MKRNILAIVTLTAFASWAGDKYIGTISSGGASASNLVSAGPFYFADAGPGAPSDGGINDAGFVIPLNQKLSVQCTYDTYLTTDQKAAATSVNGAYVYAGQFFQTSTGGQFQTTLDGGGAGIVTNQLNILPVDGGANACKVFTRLGTE